MTACVSVATRSPPSKSVHRASSPSRRPRTAFPVAVNVAVKPPPVDPDSPGNGISERGLVVSRLGFEPRTRGSAAPVRGRRLADARVHRRATRVYQLHASAGVPFAVGVTVAVKPRRAAAPTVRSSRPDRGAVLFKRTPAAFAREPTGHFGIRLPGDVDGSPTQEVCSTFVPGRRHSQGTPELTSRGRRRRVQPLDASQAHDLPTAVTVYDRDEVAVSVRLE